MTQFLQMEIMLIPLGLLQVQQEFNLLVQVMLLMLKEELHKLLEIKLQQLVIIHLPQEMIQLQMEHLLLHWEVTQQQMENFLPH